MLLEERVLVIMVGELGGCSDDTYNVIIRVLLHTSYRLLYTIAGHSEAIHDIIFAPGENYKHPIYDFKHQKLFYRRVNGTGTGIVYYCLHPPLSFFHAKQI